MLQKIGFLKALEIRHETMKFEKQNSEGLRW